MFIFMNGTLLTFENPQLRLFRLGPAFDTHLGMLRLNTMIRGPKLPVSKRGESSILMFCFGGWRGGSSWSKTSQSESDDRGGFETSKSAVLTGAFWWSRPAILWQQYVQQDDGGAIPWYCCNASWQWFLLVKWPTLFLPDRWRWFNLSFWCYRISHPQKGHCMNLQQSWWYFWWKESCTSWYSM